MKVVLKKPGAAAELVSIRRMPDITKLIGGTPEACIKAGTEHGDLHFYCDEEFVAKNLAQNFARPTDGWIICGPVVVATWEYTKDGPDWAPLSPELAAEALALLAALGVESAKEADRG